RLVHVSGYRVAGQAPATVPWSDQLVREAYHRHRPYEASKVEADALVRARARRLGVPLIMVNPGVVTGDSRTGESDQGIGLAASLADLWHGRLPALPGDARTFVPIVSVDHLARFMITLVEPGPRPESDYWVLDDATPPLPDLLSRVAEHYRVRAPRLRVPVSVIKLLPPRLTGSDPETIGFLSEDRYPTGTADEHARRHGLVPPDTMTSILRWADHLAAHRFGRATGPGRRFVDVAGLRTFQLGDAAGSRLVLPGLPVNADAWQPVVERIPDTRAVDLPGLGLSPGRRRGRRLEAAAWSGWVRELLDRTETTEIVAHSLAGGVVLEALPELSPARAPRLTLVAPFFLQPPAAAWTRLRPLVAASLRTAGPGRLARVLTGDRAPAEALRPVVEDLHRPGRARRVARLLARPSWRRRLRELLRRYPGPVRVVVGEHDPLADDAAVELAGPDIPVAVIAGAGHHPQLTHPADLIQALTAEESATPRHAAGSAADVTPRREVGRA
ncbi:MAG TPA: alpha/beta fold hydrolase, partial [Microlunatus sp.]|nr:alpha/beta fold hydrolase [Microlunatus sp.]